jgi:hypothetical protein
MVTKSARMTHLMFTDQWQLYLCHVLHISQVWQWGRFNNIEPADLAARWRILHGSPIRRPTVAPRQSIIKFSSTTVTRQGYICIPVSASAAEAIMSREFRNICHFAVFCFIIRVRLTPLFSTRKGSARNGFWAAFSSNLPRLRVSKSFPLWHNLTPNIYI